MNNTHLPLYSKQSEILVEQLLHPDSPHRNIGGIIKLYGIFEKEKFIDCLEKLAAVSDVFRHQIELKNNTYWNTFKENSTYAFKEIDFSAAENTFSKAESWFHNTFLSQVFQLEGSFIDIVLCKVSNHEHWICERTTLLWMGKVMR
ncbi:MAG: condensation domain-containing protein [Cytophagales bacterium]|nr:condensation domain-containing protein [Cytophagales bacterium]